VNVGRANKVGGDEEQYDVGAVERCLYLGIPIVAAEQPTVIEALHFRV
jgi:hypothetical protein